MACVITLKQIKRERTVYLFQSALCQHCLISQDAETEKHQHTAQSWVISIRHMNRDVLYFGVDENCILHFQQYYQGCCSVKGDWKHIFEKLCFMEDKNVVSMCMKEELKLFLNIYRLGLHHIEGKCDIR